MAKVDITIEANDVLELLSLTDIVDYYGAGDLLDEITAKEAMDHFGLIEPE